MEEPRDTGETCQAVDLDWAASEFNEKVEENSYDEPAAPPAEENANKEDEENENPEI